MQAQAVFQSLKLVCAQYVTHIGNLQNPGDFVTAAVAGAPVLMCVDDNGQLRAFHNVIRCPLPPHHLTLACGAARSAPNPAQESDAVWVAFTAQRAQLLH